MKEGIAFCTFSFWKEDDEFRVLHPSTWIRMYVFIYLFLPDGHESTLVFAV